MRRILVAAAGAAALSACDSSGSRPDADGPDAADLDSDSDGLSDSTEVSLGMDPMAADTDEDATEVAMCRARWMPTATTSSTRCW